MLMPGRRGYMLDGANGGGWSNGGGVQQNASYDSRPGINPPAEYIASVQIDFKDGFESNPNDEFVAFITDGSSGDAGAAIGGNGGYRYAFNGKEMDNDLGNEDYDFGERIYNSRIGRFFTIDPFARGYSWQTPYAYHRNNPINNVDYLGGGDPPEEPIRQSTTVKHGDNLWKIARQMLGKKATRSQIQSQVNELIDINRLNSDGDIHQGQSLYLESSFIFSRRYNKYLNEKYVYDRGAFEDFPKPTGDPRNKYEARPLAYIDKQGNFFQEANSYDKLLHASVIGADVTILTGGLRNTLANDIHYFSDKDDVDFYQKLASQFRLSGRSYMTGQITARFGSINKVKATFEGGTYIMRNAQVKYWVSSNANGTIRIEIRAYDDFNVRAQDDKDGVYNGIAEVLDPIHQATGSNTDMQTRATWEKVIK
jgi:RHS repeat-associated protein